MKVINKIPFRRICFPGHKCPLPTHTYILTNGTYNVRYVCPGKN